MNNLNKIFGLVQEMCESDSVVESPKKFQQVAAEAGVTVERLHFYLECLQEIGLVTYSTKRKTIILTEKGKTARYVFPN
jgi:predicted transcriptional regulator